jgi:pimeloyl-ACP methyl ester carboxylesterase
MAEPFQVSLDEADIADLRERLRRTRWPEAETVDDWSQGVPLAYVRELCRDWGEEYDFGFAGRLNAFPQFRTTVDGVGVHFVHVRSPHADALPLVLTHGWPGSVLEFLDVLGPLTEPEKHGGDPADAFHVVAPSLPGFGWSDKPALKISRVAELWDQLMHQLGYDRYGAQGGDWGAAVTNALARSERVAGVHVNFAPVRMDQDDPTPEERRALADLEEFRRTGSGYSAE